MTGLLPDPVPLEPPAGDPRALEDLTGRLTRAAALLGELGEQLGTDAAAAPTWAGRDAAAATGQVQRVGALAHEAAGALLRAGARVAQHRDQLEDARGRLAALRAAQEEDYGAAAARMGGIVDPAEVGSTGALEALRGAESARRRVAEAIREGVADDAAATASVLADCGAVAGSDGSRGDATAVARYLEELLPGWHEVQLAQRGRDLAAALQTGDDASREEAARQLLPSAGEGVVAAALLTGLGADGFREVLRRLGTGSLSSASATARVMAAALGAPVPPAEAAAVARVRGGRHVDPREHRTLDSDLVALGMGVVLAAGRGNSSAGPPAATVREWGRQIIARERAMGGERIVDRVRLPPSDSRPGDPLEEVLVRLAGADDPAPAAGLLRAQPSWAQLLARPWDDGGAALGALVQRAGEEPGSAGDVAVRAGLRALAAGMGDDGDPAGWTGDRANVASLAPALASAVAARADVLVAPLLAEAAGGGEASRTPLRGLGHLSADPAAAGTLDRGVEGVVARLAEQDAGRPIGVAAQAVPVAAGYAAVREYGQRLAHALDEFAVQERANRSARLTDAIGEALGLSRLGAPLVPLVAVGSVVGDLDGTWDASADTGGRFPVQEAARAAGGAPGAATAYGTVAAVLGAPTAPLSPPLDWLGLFVDLLPVPGAGHVLKLAREGFGVGTAGDQPADDAAAD